MRGAALLAPLPPAGLLPIASRLAASHTNYLMQMGGVDPIAAVRRRAAGAAAVLFQREVPEKILAEAARHLSPESPRALFDLSLRLHWALPQTDHRPLFVLGAEGDLICTPDDVRATASITTSRRRSCRDSRIC